MGAKQYDCLPAMWNMSGDGEVADDPMPLNRVRLTAWLAEREKRLSELQALERGFVTTRNPAHLKDSMFNGEYGKAETLEPLPEPVALFNAAAFLADGRARNYPAGQWLELRNKIATELFPGIEIREVHLLNGEPRMAYVGVTSRELVAAVTLRLEQMELAQKIRRGNEALKQTALYRPASPLVGR
jgi:hypothetical protein